HFSADFLKSIPADKLREVARQWRRDELADGPVELIRIDDATPTRLTAIVRGKATDRYTQVKLGVNPAGQISMLWLGPVLGVKRGDITTWAKFDDKLTALPGHVSFAAAAVPPTSGLPVVP